MTTHPLPSSQGRPEEAADQKRLSSPATTQPSQQLDPSCEVEPTKAGQPALAPRTILIVDDEINIRESLAAVLREENYNVHLAENGRVAVREFLHGSPDLILLDLNMPDTDGWKAFDLLARLAPALPVIIITARAGQESRATQAGVDVLLEKPLDIPTLLNTIRDLLSNSHEHDATKANRDRAAAVPFSAKGG